jgi:DNA mismatch repair protein MSH5
MCSSFSQNSIQTTFLADLAEFYKEGESINGILFALEKIVDLEAMDEKKRFIVKNGLDPLLDEKREVLKDFMENFNEMSVDEALKKVNNSEDAFQFAYFPEMGFVIGTRLNLEQLNLQSIEVDGIELLLNTVDSRIFRTQSCKTLNEEYEKRMSEIIAHELKIFKKLIKYINENFAELVDAFKICSKFDCLIAFSFVSKKFHYVKPNITTDQQISIIKGRHPLIEQIKSFVPSTTIIDDDNKNFIQIIRAPNSTGKSVYIKQIALICYMTFIGCFVPAESCTVSLLHSIYTRIYTPESVYQNESAFMSDLQQMSKVIMNSTNKSLILIDEFAKGTYYKDGIAILTAVIEHFAERENLTPFVFITTHYAQIFKLLTPSQFLCFKTISTKQNNANIFQSTYELTEGVNDQKCFTEFPESKMIMSNIFNQKERDGELKIFNESTLTSIKAFVFLMARQMLRKNSVSYQFIKDIYSKIDIEEFLNL